MTRRYPVMPQSVGARLRRMYEALPEPRPGVRWAGQDGADFITEVQAAEERYGPRQCQEAIGCSRTSIHDWKKLRLPAVLHSGGIPTIEEVRPALSAYRAVRARRRRGHYASRSSREYYDMYRALAPLREKYILPVIAQRMGLHTDELRPFEREPTYTADQRRQLAALVMLAKSDEREYAHLLQHLRARMPKTKIEEYISAHTDTG